MNLKIIGSFFAVLLLVISIGYYLQRNGTHNMTSVTKFGTEKTAILYKSPTCGCCEGYAKELEQQGFIVKVVTTKTMSNIKDKYRIPTDKQSCHTIEIGDYVVEGHVPFEAVEKLLTELPAIDGIGLARMPAGTPGMPGVKKAPYVVYQMNNGNISEYITI